MSLARWVVSFGGCGFAPAAPGTAGTAGAAVTAGVILWLWPERAEAHWLELCVAWVVFASVLTVVFTPRIEREGGKKDPQVVVTDEVAGYWATLAGLSGPDPAFLVAGFFLFRLLDILKPWPANALERLPGGWGVLLDDVMAGLYGAAILFAVERYVV